MCNRLLIWEYCDQEALLSTTLLSSVSNYKGYDLTSMARQRFHAADHSPTQVCGQPCFCTNHRTINQIRMSHRRRRHIAARNCLAPTSYVIRHHRRLTLRGLLRRRPCDSTQSSRPTRGNSQRDPPQHHTAAPPVVGIHNS